MAGQCAFHCILTVLASHLLISSGISQLDIAKEPQDVVTIPGEPLLMECGVTGEQPIGITWRHNNTDITLSSHRYVLTNGSLWFAKVAGSGNESLDRGRYQCCANNSYGVVCSQSAELSIARLAGPVVHLTNPAVVVNGTARLSCQVEAHPVPTITWTKDDRPVPQNDSDRFNALESGVLQIYPVEASDAGYYRCSALNTYGEKSSPGFHLNITTDDSVLPHIPLIIAGPRNATLTSGSNYLLECAVSTLSLDVEWSRKDGKSIPKKHRKIVGDSNLLLTNLRLPQSGVYVCTARDPRNSSAVQSEEATVNVVELPVFTLTPTDLSEVDGAKARFHCSMRGTPTPKLTWIHNGVVMKTGGRTSIMQNNDLVVWNLRATDAGIYQCMGSNEAGEIWASALLTVSVSAFRPEAPRNLSALPVDSQSILIAWIPPNETVTAYTLHYFETSGYGEEAFKPVSGRLYSYIVDNLHPYTNYTFYMRSYSRAPSPLSPWVIAMTSEGVPSCGPSFDLTSNTPHSIKVHWEAVKEECRNGIIIKYRYCYRPQGHMADYTCREIRDTNRNKAMIQGLKPSNTYNVYLSAATVKGFGRDTEWKMIRTPALTKCTEPPQYSMAWEGLNSTYVKVTWQEFEPTSQQQQTEQVYSIDSFQLSAKSEADGSIETVYLGPEQRVYEFSDLEPRTSYTLELFANNQCGTGQEWVVTITTRPGNTEAVSIPPGQGYNIPPPTDLRAIAVTPSSVQLIWRPPVTDINLDYYQVTYSNLQGVLMSVFSSSYQATVTGLKPYTMYQFTVQGCLNVGDIKGRPSQQVFSQTSEDEPSAPRQVGAVPLDPHTVSVTWKPPSSTNGIIVTYMILYNVDLGQPENEWNKTERSGDTQSDTVADLDSNTKYYFRVRASTQAGTGPASKPVAVKTLSDELVMEVKPPGASKLDSNVEKVILASIVLVTTLVLVCTVVVVCRGRIWKRNHDAASLAADCHGRRHDYPPQGNQRDGHNITTQQQTNGDMEMELSPMLHSNGGAGNHSNLQGNGTPGRRLCNSNSNHSPYFARDITNQSSYCNRREPASMDHDELYSQVMVHHDNTTSSSTSSTPNHQHSIQNGRASTNSDTSLYNEETQYLPDRQFNSGQFSPQVSGQSSPQLHMDQGEPSMPAASKERSASQQPLQRDKLGLNLPCTLSSLATTSDTCAPSGSHDSSSSSSSSQLPPEINHRDDEAGLNIWRVGDRDPHRLPQSAESTSSERPHSCTGSTGGDSGLVDDVEWDSHDTSPDFIHKVLQQMSGESTLQTTAV